MWTPWQTEVQRILQVNGGLDHREIRQQLRGRFGEHTRSEVNSFLYSNLQSFRRETGPSCRPIWFSVHTVKPSPAIAPPEPEKSAPIWTDQLELYPWQRRALDAWADTGDCGVVEAVTGTGKTRLALAAIEETVRTGGRAAVLVHTRELVEQWCGQLETMLSDCGHNFAVGRLGGGHDETLSSHAIIVATAQTAMGKVMLPSRIIPFCSSTLLVADEVHHYASEHWRQALEPAFTRRLGLTATYERPDDGIDEVLDPYFSGVCYEVDYEEALDEDAIAHFKVGLIGVEMSSSNSEEYDAMSREVTKFQRRLVSEFGLPAEPFGEFMRQAARLAATKTTPGARAAGFFFSAINKRRRLLATCSEKLEKLCALAPAVRAATRTIIFTESKLAAEQAIAALAARGVHGAVLDGTMNVDDRASVFAGFEDGTHEVVAAPMLLDEGVDVPSADLAIVLASSRSKRQMIQRMGRILRKKRDGRLARLAILFVEGTVEDPADGRHFSFLEAIANAADEIATFESTRPAKQINAWLNDW